MTGTPPLRLHTTTFDHPLHKRFFYPTTGIARYRLDANNNTIRKGTTNQSSYESPRQTGTGRLEYNSRKARKARLALKTHHIQHHPDGSDKPSTSPANVTVRVDSVRSEFKPHLKLDITFWLAVTFVLGSCVWVVNGFTVLLPLYLGRIENSENLTSTYFKTAAAQAFVGGVIFEVGSYLMVVEALNRGQETGFGAAVVHLLQSGHPTPSRSRSSLKDHDSNALEKSHTELIGVHPGRKRFIWGKPLWRDLGYDAALIQLIAATVFLVSTITGLPGVIPGFPSSGNAAIVKVFFWTPQVVGGTGFIISALFLMIETQKKWWLPNLTDLGWHISFWNLVGGVGFTLCGAMGYNTDERWVDNSAISTFWGSWAFLIGSVMQLYEAVWREPEVGDLGHDVSKS
ncbi:hypothetical protein HD553DRAFT_269127 [Filobasidium floriforme]|uniref:uncharacterized protein n=1 Tax=Filobasidium floriforme TaxID=5210 RepID=UPI001E8EA218|nr:uncharacterized protein HD553DRAFT_269127 [Filobasidium floriforme]KAH8088200.1 hypothetical protein HD553DRAFT_269127 [Filobasidium floriforme]